MAPPIACWRNTLFPATAVSDWTTVVSTHCKQKVSPAANIQPCSLRLQQCNEVADSLIEIQLPLAVVQPRRWFANRCVCAVHSFVTTNNAQIYSGMLGLNFLGKTEAYTGWKAWAWLRLRSKHTHGSSKEYAWLTYDWKKIISCAVRVVGLIRLEFDVDVYCWMTIKSRRAHL